MNLAAIEQGSDALACFETELMRVGLLVSDLDADGARYFVLNSIANRLQAYVGLIRFGEDGLLRSFIVPAALRGMAIGARAGESIAQWAWQNGIKRLWLLTTSAERYFIRQGFRFVPRHQVPVAIAGTQQFSATCPSSAVLMCLTLA